MICMFLIKLFVFLSLIEKWMRSGVMFSLVFSLLLRCWCVVVVGCVVIDLELLRLLEIIGIVSVFRNLKVVFLLFLMFKDRIVLL